MITNYTGCTLEIMLNRGFQTQKLGHKIGLKYKEETSEMLYLEYNFLL